MILLKQELAGADLRTHVKPGYRHMSNTDTLVSVIVGVCRQDPERWRQFDAIYRPMLLAYLRKQGLKESEASDVVQDIFVKLLGKIHTYDCSKCRFRTWLFTVANHAFIDYLRRQASRNKAMEGWKLQMLRANPSDSVKLEQQWARIHREKILAHALRSVRGRVPSEAWTCFEQRLLRDRPGAEIATDLGIDPNLVYVNACRVMKLVRAVCEEFDEDMSHDFKSDLSPGR
jgi:RNA polymerase sigma factor (sigma-70 family)